MSIGKGEIINIFPQEYRLLIEDKFKYDKLLGDSKDVLENTNRVIRQITETGIDVIFISTKTYYSQISYAKMMRRLGLRCAAISLSNKQTHLSLNIFEFNETLTIVELVNVLRRTNLILFSQGWLFRHHVNLIIEKFKAQNRHYLEIMDLNSLLFPKESIPDSTAKLMAKVWGHDAVSNNSMQNWCETTLINECDRIYFPGGLRYFEKFNLDSNQINRKYFFCSPIDSDCFVKNTQQPEGYVFCGGIPPFDPRRIYEFFGDAQLVNLLSKALARCSSNAKIYLYNNPLIADNGAFNDLYKPLRELSQHYQNFKFQIGETGYRIREIIQNFKFGLMVYDFTGNLMGNDHFDSIIPSKFYLYMEAGIPVLVSERFTTLSEEVEKYKLGLVVRDSKKYEIFDIFEEMDTTRLKNNIYEYREDKMAEMMKNLM